MAGWIGFAGIIIVIIGGLDVFQTDSTLGRQLLCGFQVWIPRGGSHGAGMGAFDPGSAAHPDGLALLGCWDMGTVGYARARHSEHLRHFLDFWGTARIRSGRSPY